MQFVKILRGDDELVHGVDHFLQERCGRKLEQVIPYRDGNKIIFVTIFNDPEVNYLNQCHESPCKVHPTGYIDNYNRTFHHYHDHDYHAECCPSPWHEHRQPQHVGFCGECQKVILSTHQSCAHPSPEGRELKYHKECCDIHLVIG